MGTYLSKYDSARVSELQELKEKTSYRDMTISSKSIDKLSMLSVTGNYDHNCNYTLNGEEVVTTKIDRKTNECCNMSPKVHIELLKYSPTTFDNLSNKTENSPFKSDDDLGKVIDVCKLLSQLLNAKVILEKLEEPLTKSSRRYPVPRAASVRTNVDIDDGKDATDETNSKNYTHRYCANCKKTVIARINDPKAKNCSHCKTAMTHLCIKCNEKHYKRYAYLTFHWDRCNGNDTSLDRTGSNIGDTSIAPSIYAGVDQSESNIEDTSTADGHNDSILELDEDKFIVKKQIRHAENLLEQYIRYCSECEVAMTSHVNLCSACDKYLIFACKKCNKKYVSKPSMLYHLKSQCYPINEYQCTHCKFTTNIWSTMRNHFKNIHTNRSSYRCKICSLKVKYKHSLKLHMEIFHNSRKAVDAIFRCDGCKYSTTFRRNLRRHQNLCH